MNQFLKWILAPFKKKDISNKITHQANTSSDTILQSNSQDILAKTQETRDVGWFSRKNNLVQEFSYTPIPVYAGPQDKESMGWLDADGKLIHNTDRDGDPKIDVYRGYIIQFFNISELDNHKKTIDFRLHNMLSITNFLSEEEFRHLKEVNKSGEQLLEDDVDLLKDKHLPDLTQPTEFNTYVIGVDPYQNKILEEGKRQSAEVENLLKAKTGISIDNSNQAEIDDSIDIKNIMNRAAEKKNSNPDREPKINDIS